MRLPHLLAAAGLAVALTACSAEAEPEKPDTFAAVGFMRVIDQCDPVDYPDVTDGAPVKITNSKGDVVAIGNLREGKSEGEWMCRYDFKVEGVPSGEGPYAVEVSHRGEIPFNEDQASGLALSLGVN